MRTSNPAGFDLRAAVDGLRESFSNRVAQATDPRGAILGALVDGPKNGYQVIQATGAKPGTVYPLLQLLTDEGLVTAAQDGERKVYTLTEEGKAAAVTAEKSDGNAFGALPKAGAKLASAVGQVVQSGSAEQTEKAIAVIDEARKKLYAILAED